MRHQKTPLKIFASQSSDSSQSRRAKRAVNVGTDPISQTLTADIQARITEDFRAVKKLKGVEADRPIPEIQPQSGGHVEAVKSQSCPFELTKPNVSFLSFVCARGVRSTGCRE